jgi:dihydroorotase-like cyclic amidohydrolase
MAVFEFPGFIDVHVHFRDPGMTAAETLASGAEAAAQGGFAAVVTMPNTAPAIPLLQFSANTMLCPVCPRSGIWSKKHLL